MDEDGIAELFMDDSVLADVASWSINFLFRLTLEAIAGGNTSGSAKQY